MAVTLQENERLDELHRNGYKIIQDKGRFCFGMDAVLLSGFARVKPGEKVLDLEPERALSRSCWRRRPMENISQVLKFSRRVRIWRPAV